MTLVAGYEIHAAVSGREERVALEEQVVDREADLLLSVWLHVVAPVGETVDPFAVPYVHCAVGVGCDVVYPLEIDPVARDGVGLYSHSVVAVERLPCAEPYVSECVAVYHIDKPVRRGDLLECLARGVENRENYQYV